MSHFVSMETRLPTSAPLLLHSMFVLMVVAATLTLAQTVRGERTALIIIDVQDCFLTNGSLAVKGSEEIIPVINKLRNDFDDHFALVVLSQDWHCADHVSFASQHENASPLMSINLTYNSDGQLCKDESVPTSFRHAVDCSENNNSSNILVPQTLWPDHCVQNVTTGPTSANFSPLLLRESDDIIIKKGYRCGIDSYSAFYDNGRFAHTELDSILKHHNISMVVLVGLALDYCVYYTAKDAHLLGYKVLTVVDACRGVSQESVNAALIDMEKTGIVLVQAEDLEGALQDSNEGDSYSEFNVVILLVAVVCILASFIV